jgi:phage terminase small subunit
MTTNFKPPSHLKAATRKWIAWVLSTFELEPHHHKLLVLAGEAWDRAAAANAAIQEHGMVYQDRFGAPRLRPEVNVKRDAEISFARLLRELDLDCETTPESPRPPALKSNRRGND